MKTLLTALNVFVVSNEGLPEYDAHVAPLTAVFAELRKGSLHSVIFDWFSPLYVDRTPQTVATGLTATCVQPREMLDASTLVGEGACS